MLISYNWLKELTATALEPQQVRERLTMVGLAIDAVEDHGTDAVLDVEVPSNRPDCLSHVGIAREVAVIEHGRLRLPADKSFPTSGNAAGVTSVEIVNKTLCPRYAARLVRGVKIGPSPAWLAERLETIGQRPINNVADITNYVLHELGQPLHAFDFAKLTGRRIVVRPAAPGEKLKTLDGVERILSADMLVIADAERPVALAGVMGGEDSEISETTTDVLIESAYFNPDSVRRTARALGMDTEASRRFERGADCENVLKAQQRCVQLICELAGGVATEDAIDIYPEPIPSRIVRLRTERVRELTSITVAPQEMHRILVGLGFEVVEESSELLVYRVPSWRIDVEQEEDLVEEIARHAGYDKIASTLPPANAAGEYQPSEMRQRSLRRALNAFGFDEAINFSFIPKEDDYDLIPAFAGREEGLAELENPIIEDSSRMRQTLLPGLLSSLRHNLNHGIRDVKLFEIGRIFALSTPNELPEERLALAFVATGGILDAARAQADREIDFFDVKGAIETAIDWMNLEPVSFAPAHVKHLRSGQSAEIKSVKGRRCGTIGRLAESIAERLKFRQPVFVMELDLDELFSAPEKVVQYSPLPRYPSVVRDLSLLLSREFTFDEVVAAIDNERIPDVHAVKLVGTFSGANIPADKRSLTLRIEYRSDERTLRDEEVETRHVQLTSSLLKKFQAEQR